MDHAGLLQVLGWVSCLGATVVAIFLASKWWNGGRGKFRKQPAFSPGVRVVRVQDDSCGSKGLGGWGALVDGIKGDGKNDASKWEQSKQKGDLGYYFAHHTSMKELAPEDYRMNGPRLLSKGDASAATNGTRSPGSASPPPPPLSSRRRAQQISSYSWEDHGEEVRLTFRQSEWEWSKVDQEEIGVEWGPRRFRLSIDSSEYGLHTIDLPRLNGEVADVRVLKKKSRLVVTLIKGGRGSYSRKAPWNTLQASPEKSTD